MPLSLGVEIVMSALLAVTLVYCAILERRLAMLRKGQDGLKRIIGDLNGAIVSAGACMRALKDAAANAGEALDERLGRARAMADELALLVASGERAAARMEVQTGLKNGHARPATPAVLANRLEALRPEILKNVR
jgi:hypothetical protein